MSKFDIEPLSTQNIGLLYTLVSEVYGRRKPKGYFEAKYDASYCGKTSEGAFAVQDGKALSFAGVIPTVFSINGKQAIGAQSCDTMTVPSVRRTGVGSLVAREAHRRAKLQGIDFIYGFANQDSTPWLTTKLGFTNMGQMNRYTIPLRTNLFRKVLRKAGLGRFSKRVEHEIDNVVLTEGFDGVLYTPEFIKYKSHNHNFILGGKGSKLWLSQGGGLAGAFQGGDVKDALNIVQKNTNASSVTFMFSPGLDHDRQFALITDAKAGLTAACKDLSGKHNLGGLKFQLGDADIF
jgi:hypothetical protein